MLHRLLPRGHRGSHLVYLVYGDELLGQQRLNAMKIVGLVKQFGTGTIQSSSGIRHIRPCFVNSSGGAVNALALVAKHPEQVRTLVAHEPPSVQELPDREEAVATFIDIRDTYLRAGLGPAMAKFIALVSHEGPLPADFASRPGPDPAMFGMSATDDGSRNDPLMQNMTTCGTYRHDVDALRAASTRVVIGVGEESGQQIAGRGGAAVAGLLGTPPVIFPGGHDGFSGGEYGRSSKPDEFAATLREVLAAS